MIPSWKPFAGVSRLSYDVRGPFVTVRLLYDGPPWRVQRLAPEQRKPAPFLAAPSRGH
jgi:hypothetical protein